ncbi:hypothetical protein KKG71_02755, partial [Patescibacteria group bacterium]|nr:hypothetical protein [Patescibacteria group bacterium]
DSGDSLRADKEPPWIETVCPKDDVFAEFESVAASSLESKEDVRSDALVHDLIAIMYLQGILSQQDVEELCAVADIPVAQLSLVGRKKILWDFYDECPPLYETDGKNSPFLGSIFLAKADKSPLSHKLAQLLKEKIGIFYEAKDEIIGDYDLELSRHEDVKRIILVLNGIFETAHNYGMANYHRDDFFEAVGEFCTNIIDNDLREFIFSVLGDERYIKKLVNELFKLTMTELQGVKIFAINRLCALADENYQNFMLVLTEKTFRKRLVAQMQGIMDLLGPNKQQNLQINLAHA